MDSIEQPVLRGLSDVLLKGFGSHDAAVRAISDAGLVAVLNGASSCWQPTQNTKE